MSRSFKPIKSLLKYKEINKEEFNPSVDESGGNEKEESQKATDASKDKKNDMENKQNNENAQQDADTNNKNSNQQQDNSSGFMKKVVKFLLYKEPKNEELGFELLEEENSGSQQETNSKQNSSAQQKNGQNTSNNQVNNNIEDSLFNDLISTQLCNNLEKIRQEFIMPKNKDIILREFKIGRQVKAFMAYLNGMMDKNTLNLTILPQLMSKDVFDDLGKECPVDYLIENILTVHDLRKTNKYSDIIMQVLSGVSALFVDGCGDCILIETREYEKRNVEQPITETVVQGSHEAFTENLRTNITLVRKIIKNQNLISEILPVGNTNNSNCAVMYLKGVANPKVIQEVRRRIEKISTDFILGDGMLEQFIEDNSFMLLPQTLTTERPDRTASFIMEGQVVIISDGTPFAIAVPMTFFRLLHTSEDMSVRWPVGTFLRLIRLFGVFCAVMLPGLYIALTLYHVEMLPTELLTSIALSKETVPFPTVIEVLIMEISFELIREGGIRVPGVIGQTLGIVGALILGQAAVSAGLVSPIMVIIVSITGLGSFAISNYMLGLSLRVIRFLFIFAGATLGFYGITLMFTLLVLISCSMKSFGVPFFAPIAPRTKINRDVILRYPIWTQKNRPDGLQTPNTKRQGENVKKWTNKKTRSGKA